MRKALRRLLTTHGFQVEDYESGTEFLATLPSNPADCLVLDLHMPEPDGFGVLATMARQGVTLPVVVITGHDEPDAAERTRLLGAKAFLTKPVNETALLAAIRSTLPETRSSGSNGPRKNQES